MLRPAIRFDIGRQGRHVEFIGVLKLYANMENILREALRMNDPRSGIEGLALLYRGLQIEPYFDHHARYLPWNALVFGKNMMGRVTTAAECDAAGRQVDYYGGEVFTRRQAHCTRDICVKAEVLSFFPFHVALVCRLPLRMIFLRIHFVMRYFRNQG